MFALLLSLLFWAVFTGTLTDIELGRLARSCHFALDILCGLAFEQIQRGLSQAHMLGLVVKFFEEARREVDT